MASTTFTVSSYENFDFGSITTVINGNNTPDYVRGTVITFTNTSLSDVNITFYNLSAAVWSNSAQFTLAPNQSTTRTILSGASLGAGSVLVKTGSTYLGNGVFDIISGIDSTPDAFSLGPNQSNIEPNTTVFLQSVFLTGLSSATGNISTSNMEFSVKNTGIWRTTLNNVANNTQLYCRTTAPAGYDTPRTCRLTINNVWDEVIITTSSTPNQGTYVPFPRTTGMSVSLEDVIDFFGGVGSPRNLLSYVKNSAYVPNIPQNANISTSAPVSLLDFRNSGTTFYFVRPPKGDADSVNTLSAGQTLELGWTINGTRGWEIGYSPSMTSNTEYRFEVTATESITETGDFTLPTITPSGYGNWSTNNTYIRVAKTESQGTESNYRGVITIYARSSYDNAIVTSQSFSYSLYFFGN